MASLTLAALCSAATYRDGLLSVLEAGLERFSPDGYPAVVTPQLVVRIDWDPSDFGSAHTLRVVVEHDDSERLADVGWGVTYEPPPDADPDLAFFTVVSHPLTMQVRRDGLYTVEISLDGESARTLRLRVLARLPQP